MKTEEALSVGLIATSVEARQRRERSWAAGGGKGVLIYSRLTRGKGVLIYNRLALKEFIAMTCI